MKKAGQAFRLTCLALTILSWKTYLIFSINTLAANQNISTVKMGKVLNHPPLTPPLV